MYYIVGHEKMHEISIYRSAFLYNLRLHRRVAQTAIGTHGNRVYRTYNVFGNLVYEKAEDPEGKDRSSPPIAMTARGGSARPSVTDIFMSTSTMTRDC